MKFRLKDMDSESIHVLLPKCRRSAALLAVLSPAALCTVGARAQTFDDGRVFEEASIRAPAGLRCMLHARGGKSTQGIPVVTDSDGFARFYAIRAKAGDSGQHMALDCKSDSGKSVAIAVDLCSTSTFASHPLDPSKEPGVDRPALTSDPLSCSQAELIDRGYGVRPDPDQDAAIYDLWLKAATIHGRILAARRSDSIEHGVYSMQDTPWVGSVLTGSASYDTTSVAFNVPALVPGGDGTSVTATRCLEWLRWLQ